MSDPIGKLERPNWLAGAVVLVILAGVGLAWVTIKSDKAGLAAGKKSVAAEQPAETSAEALQKQIEAAEPPVQTAAATEATEEVVEEPAAPAEPEKMELLATTPNCKVYYTYDSYNYVYVVEATTNKSCTVSTVNTR